MRNKIAIPLGLAVLTCVGIAPALADPPRMAAAASLLPPYAIATIVRSAGMDPISRPALQGRGYVLQAVDPYGVEVRVVVDARIGEIVAIRPVAVNGAGWGPRIAGVPADGGWMEGDDIPPPRPPRRVPTPLPSPVMSAPPAGPTLSHALEAAPMRAPLPRARPVPVKSAKAALPPSNGANASEHTGSIRAPAQAPSVPAAVKTEESMAAKIDAAQPADPAAAEGAAVKPDAKPSPTAAPPAPSATLPPAPFEE